MAEVLNPTLYRRLNALFGRIKVSNAGESMISQAAFGIENEKRLLIPHAGEYYQACCPYCNDTRYRLYVNHMYGQIDGHGRKMRFLAICYNEGCLSRAKNREDFVEKVEDIHMAAARVRKGITVSLEAREVMPPGPVTLLRSLRKNHPARVYITSRGFDPDEISDKYNVGLCTDSRYSIAINRLIIPIYDDGKLRGWQARYIGELDWKGPDRKSLRPKYYSCPDSDFRSRCIYGIESMREWQTGILVEGPTDRWRLGAMSGCIFGNTVTEAQRNKFLAVFRGRTGVLLLDPEEFDKASTQRTIKLMKRGMSGNFCGVKLPEGTDPGSLGREFMRAYIKEEAAKQGVTVTYRKYRKTK